MSFSYPSIAVSPELEIQRRVLERLVAETILHPLSDFYREFGAPLPEVRLALPRELPEAARALLVHDRDMTPTLEAAHGGKLGLRVLQYAATGETVKRLVTLVVNGDQAVGMGAIHIFIARLPPAARERVLERREPFGAILQQNGVIHYSRPVAYFQVTADAIIMDALGMRGSHVLHGRRNTIWNSSGQELANVVEILRP